MRFPIVTGQYFGLIQDFKASPEMTVITVGHNIEFDQPFKRHHFDDFTEFFKFYKANATPMSLSKIKTYIVAANETELEKIFYLHLAYLDFAFGIKKEDMEELIYTQSLSLYLDKKTKNALNIDSYLKYKELFNISENIYSDIRNLPFEYAIYLNVKKYLNDNMFIAKLLSLKNLMANGALQVFKSALINAIGSDPTFLYLYNDKSKVENPIEFIENDFFLNFMINQLPKNSVLGIEYDFVYKNILKLVKVASIINSTLDEHPNPLNPIIGRDLIQVYDIFNGTNGVDLTCFYNPNQHTFSEYKWFSQIRNDTNHNIIKLASKIINNKIPQDLLK